MKVYIASPFFNAEQLERVEFIEKLLHANEINYFSPRHDTYVQPNSSHVERKKAFHDNVEAIENCDFVIAVTDGKDVGTIFEAGYAFAKQIPLIYFAETLGEAQFNLMLAMSGRRICLSRSELYDIVKLMKTNECQDEEIFEGEIE